MTEQAKISPFASYSEAPPDGGMGSAIAIVGLSCRLPGGATPEAFAELLWSGRHAIAEVPERRWSKGRYFHPEPGQRGKTYTFAAGCLDEIYAFDAGFFGISPREAASIDPQQRLLLELAYEAMEEAGIAPSRLSEAGVFVGGSSWDFAARSFSDAAALDTSAMQGAALSSMANRISYVFDFKGPSLTVDTACSSSLVALHLACAAIRRGEIESAVVGGVNLLITPQSYVGFARARMLSPNGLCRPFDAAADGYVRSEGGVVFILKPLARALADQDPIHGVIHGSGINQDGRTNGFSVPSGAAQAALLREVYESAGISPTALAFVEAHGTGTAVGDPIEAGAIGAILGKARAEPLPIGSVKSQIGHLEPASGLAGVLKVLLAFRRGEVPPTVNHVTPNPRIPFADLNLAVVTTPTALRAGPLGLIAGVNSFGFGGTNAHAIIAAPPAPREPTPHAEESDQHAPLLLSARSEEALAALVDAWRERLGAAETPQAPRALLAGAARRREHHRHRLAVLAGTASEMAARLAAFAGGEETAGLVAGEAVAGRLAFVFSGNGSQWSGMARDAVALSAEFRAALAEVDAHLAPELGWSVAARLVSDNLADPLRQTAIAQPLLFAIQAASVIALRTLGVRAAGFVGHSVGEVAAAFASGALTLDQACHVIIQRSHAQQATHGTGRMAVLGLGAAEAEGVLAREGLPLAIAAINARASVTLAGPADALARLRDIADREDWPFTPLDLDYAFHSPAMAPIHESLLAGLGEIVSAAPEGCLVSSVTGEVVAAGGLDATYWWHNVRAPVRFQAALERLVAEGMRVFLEIGPQPVLQSFAREALQSAGQRGRVMPLLTRQPAEADPLARAAALCFVAGTDLGAARALQGPAAIADLPRYPWQRQIFRASPSAEGVELASPVCEHPLLGFRDPLVAHVWTNDLSTAVMPWLADHVVDGTALLPAAAMIDMALAAARARHPDAAVLELLDLEIARPLPLAPGQDRGTRAVIHGEDRFELASRQRLVDEPLTVHASATLAPGDRAASILAWAPAATGGVAISADAVYAAAAALRLSYGPAFQRVEAVWRDPAEGRGRASLLPPAIDRVALGHLIDPTLLDGAFQALLAILPADRIPPECMVMPWRFGRIRLLRPAGARPVAAWLRPREAGPRSFAADLALVDAAGEIVLEILGCWFVAVSKAGAAADLGFSTKEVPSLRQAPQGRGASGRRARILAAATEGGQNAHEATLLADAYLGLAAWEALQTAADAGGIIAPASSARQEQAIGWLVEDGLAGREAGGTRLVPAHDLPPAAEVWQTLFFDWPEAAAETALLAALAPWLSAGLIGERDTADAPATQPLLPEALAEQALRASPAAHIAREALLGSVRVLAEGGTRGAHLRVGLVGTITAALVRALLRWAEARGIGLRLVALAGDEARLAALAPLLDAVPDLGVMAWQQIDSAAGEGFDVVVSLFALSGPAETPPAPETLARLLAPGGMVIGVEPAASRFATFFFREALGGVAPSAGAALCERFAQAGLTAETRTLIAPFWPLTLMTAEAAQSETPAPSLRFTLFADLSHTLAMALAARRESGETHPLAEIAHHRPESGVATPIVILAPDDLGRVTRAGEMQPLAAFLADLTRLLGQSESGATVSLVVGQSAEDTTVAAALAGFRRVVANEWPEIAFSVITLDATLSDDEAAARVLLDLAAPDEPEIHHARGGRLVPRLRVGLPRGAFREGPRRLEVGRPGLLGSLTWVPAPLGEPGPGEVAINVAAAALNFRDVMWAQGLLPDEALLDGFSGPALGLECAGTVRAVGPGVADLAPGDRVIAVAPAALASDVVTPRLGVMKLPDGLDFAAGATIPVAFMTAVYALGHLARLGPGERVLIHGGAGAVGLAAIQYARHRGAEIYATAGAPLRRRLLRELGVAGVFDSRSARFAEDLLAATGGEGVDVVLNSLSGPLMREGMRLLRPFGRFVEIGKLDLYRNTPVGLRPLRHNAAYFALDTDELVARRPDLGRAVLAEIAALLAQGVLRPLPYRCFGFADALEAFRLLQSSGHVGKLVLLPEPTPPPPTPPRLMPRAGVYVVSGGLSGFGLEAARFLAGQGARNLALLSRRGAAGAGAEAVLAEFAAMGVAARAFAVDVADRPLLAETLATVRREMGPIVGVLHAAMVLDDAPLAALDASRFAAVLAPKLAGALALDQATRDDPLHLFVLFSSVTTAIGTPGQASYVAANAALEALARERHAAGRPALCVQWGPIGDAGVLTREPRVGEMLTRMLGGEALSAQAALAALPRLLAAGRPVVGFADVAWRDLRQRLPGGSAPFWSEIPASARRAETGRDMRAEIAEMAPEAAVALITATLTRALAAIIGRAPTAIDAERPLASFGVDSLMAVELRTAVEAELGVAVPLLALSPETTLAGMAARLCASIQGRDQAAAEVASALLRHEGEMAGESAPATPSQEPAP